MDERSGVPADGGASWAHRLNGLSGAPLAFDVPKTKAEVLAAAGPFIRS